MTVNLHHYCHDDRLGPDSFMARLSQECKSRGNAVTLTRTAAARVTPGRVILVRLCRNLKPRRRRRPLAKLKSAEPGPAGPTVTVTASVKLLHVV